MAYLIKYIDIHDIGKIDYIVQILKKNYMIELLLSTKKVLQVKLLMGIYKK